MGIFSQRINLHNQICTSNLRFSFTHFTKRRSVFAMSFGIIPLTTLFNKINTEHTLLSFATHYDYLLCKRTQILYDMKNNAHYEINGLNYTKNSAYYYRISTQKL